jgi:hypothetical protein
MSDGRCGNFSQPWYSSTRSTFHFTGKVQSTSLAPVNISNTKSVFGSPGGLSHLIQAHFS